MVSEPHAEQTQPTIEEPPVSLVGLVLSPRSQVLAGPAACLLMVAGFAVYRIAMAAGLPRAELFVLLALGVGVALASVAVTLGLMLLVSKQTPYRRASVASIVAGLLAFLLAAPLFVLAMSRAAAG